MGNLCHKEKEDEGQAYEEEDYGDNGGIIVVTKKKPKLDPKDFMFAEKKGETLVKAPGSINGQQFIVRGCTDCEIFLLDHTAQVIIENCVNCFVFVAPCESSVYFRECKQCRFILACQQMRTRDCSDIDLLLYCGTRPTIEATKNLRIGCFEFSYFELAGQFVKAKLSTWNNPWSRIHDFTPKQGNNFSPLPADHSFTDMFDESKLIAACANLDLSALDCPVPRTAAEPRSDEEEEKLFPHDKRHLIVAFSDAVARNVIQLLKTAIQSGDVVLVRTQHLQTLDDYQQKELFGEQKDSRLGSEGLVGMDVCVVTEGFSVADVVAKDESGQWWLGDDYQLTVKFFEDFPPSDQI